MSNGGPTPGACGAPRPSAAPLPCLTVIQPWATLEVLGLKGAETRNWAPPRALIGQRLAIHAATRWSAQQAAFAAGHPVIRSAIECAGYAPSASGKAPGMLPLGAVVGTVRLAAVVEYAALDPITWRKVAAAALGDHEHGRFAWLLDQPHFFDPPAPTPGQRGLWMWTPPHAIPAQSPGTQTALSPKNT